MDELQRVESALMKAHNAGDTESAKLLAGEVNRLRASSFKQPEPSMVSKALNTAGDIGMGALQGAANIGSTLIQPIDYIRDPSGNLNKERRAGVSAGLESLGADKNSLAFQGGELGSELAGTWAAGGALSKGLGVAKYAPQLATAIETSGMAKTDLIPKLAGGAISGATQAGLINPDDAGLGAVVGGLIPAGGKLLSGATKATLGGNVSDEIKAGVALADQYGIDVPVDRILKSKPLNALAASLEYVPLSGRTEKIAKMDEQLRAALSKTMGQTDSNLDVATSKAKKELGGKFDYYLKNNQTVADNTLKTELAASQTLAGKQLTDKNAKIVNNYIDDILNGIDGNGKIDGNYAYNLKKDLDRLTKDPVIGHHMKDIKDSLMSALMRSLSPADAADFALAKKQYAAMKTIKPMVKGGFEGELSAARLANLNEDKIFNSEVKDLRKIAGQFMRGRESQHSAGQRVTLGGLTGGAALGAAAGLPTLAGSLVAGRGLTELLSSDMAKRAALKGVQPTRKAGEVIAKSTIPMLSNRQQ